MEVGTSSNPIPRAHFFPQDTWDGVEEQSVLVQPPDLDPWEETLQARRERKELIDLQGDSQRTWLDFDSPQILRIDSPRRPVIHFEAPGRLVAAPISGLLANRCDGKTSLDTKAGSESNRIAAIRALELVERHQELWLNQLKDLQRRTAQ